MRLKKLLGGKDITYPSDNGGTPQEVNSPAPEIPRPGVPVVRGQVTLTLYDTGALQINISNTLNLIEQTGLCTYFTKFLEKQWNKILSEEVK